MLYNYNPVKNALKTKLGRPSSRSVLIRRHAEHQHCFEKTPVKTTWWLQRHDKCKRDAYQLVNRARLGCCSNWNEAKQVLLNRIPEKSTRFTHLPAVFTCFFIASSVRISHLIGMVDVVACQRTQEMLQTRHIVVVDGVDDGLHHEWVFFILYRKQWSWLGVYPIDITKKTKQKNPTGWVSTWNVHTDNEYTFSKIFNGSTTYLWFYTSNSNTSPLFAWYRLADRRY